MTELYPTYVSLILLGCELEISMRWNSVRDKFDTCLLFCSRATEVFFECGRAKITCILVKAYSTLGNDISCKSLLIILSCFELETFT